MKVRKKNYRAKQFMPFSPLKGYYDLILAAEHVSEDKRVLSEEQCGQINEVLQQVAVGMSVIVTHYAHNAYEIKRGPVTELSDTFHYLIVADTRIAFDDIFSIAIDET